MTADEIRALDVSRDDDDLWQELALKNFVVAREIAAQLAELNQKLSVEPAPRRTIKW